MKTRSILIGALEIKRHYQMNMAMGFGISILLMVAIVTSLLLFFHPEPISLPGGCPGPINISIPLPVNVYIPLIEHHISPGNKPAIGIPVPGPEIEIGSENNFPRMIDLAGLAPQTPITGLGGGIFIDTQKVIEQAFPPIDTFIPVDFQPIQITVVQPHYPDLAMRAGIECKIYIKALIDKEGQVREAVVVNPLDTDIGFESVAIEAAMLSTWKPAINNGLPVAVWVTYAVDFRLK